METQYYRLLNPGETLIKGDEYWDSPDWLEMCHCADCQKAFNANRRLVIRRKLEFK